MFIMLNSSVKRHVDGILLIKAKHNFVKKKHFFLSAITAWSKQDFSTR